MIDKNSDIRPGVTATTVTMDCGFFSEDGRDVIRLDGRGHGSNRQGTMTGRTNECLVAVGGKDGQDEC